MNKLNKLSIVCAALAASTLCADAFADGRRDLYFQQATERYFNLPQGARTAGMGGSSVVTSSDSTSVVGNPAGLGFLKGAEVSASYGYDTLSGNEHPTYGEVEQKTNSGMVLGTFPISPVQDDLPANGNVGLGWSGYSGEVEDDSFGVENDGYRVHGAYAIALSDSTTLGYGLTYFNDELKGDLFDNSMTSGFRHTLGVQNKISDSVTFGASTFVGHGDRDVEIYSLGTTENSDMMEVGVDIGVAYKLAKTLIAASVDYQHYDSEGGYRSGPDEVVYGGDEQGNAFAIRLGVEQELADWLKGRLGYRYQGNADYDYSRTELSDLNGSAKYNAWSAGLGVAIPVNGQYIKAVNLDYGVDYRAVGHDDWSHYVTASVPFGVCK